MESVIRAESGDPAAPALLAELALEAATLEGGVSRNKAAAQLAIAVSFDWVKRYQDMREPKFIPL